MLVRDLSPAALTGLLRESKFERFPVVLDERLAGVLGRKEAEAALAVQRAPELEPAVTCRPDSSIRELSDRIIASSGGIVVVLGPEGSGGGVIGVVTMHDLLRAQKMFTAEHPG